MMNVFQLKFIVIYFLVQDSCSVFLEPREIEILEGFEYSFSMEYCTISIAHHQLFETNVSALCYCNYDPLTKTSTYCSVPGPTFIVYAGTTISMTWYNNLMPIGESVPGQSFHNVPKDLDITNVHLHGMHISPAEDNVLLSIMPGYSNTYIYHIPFTHSAGTQWLHAHHHGSASFQIHGGLFSALLLKYTEDRNDLFDVNLLNMKENVLVFHMIYVVTNDLCDCNDETLWQSLYYFPPQLNEQECIDGKSCFVCFSYCYEYCSFPIEQRTVYGFTYDVTSNYTESQFFLFLVNGQFEPVIDDLTVNTFRRLRFINTYNQFYIQYLFPLTYCEWYLIAIDGIFVNDADSRCLNTDPYFGEYLLPPGGRIDVIVKCSEIGTYVIQTTENNDNEDSLETITRAPGGNILFKIQVNSEGEDTVTEKPVIYPPQPDYLMDLRTTTTDTMKQCDCNTYTPESNAKLTPWANNECGLTFNMAKSHNINGFTFDITTPMTYLDFDSVYEFEIIPHMHPLHHHTNPFQVQHAVGNNGFIAQAGDWFDTFGVGKGAEVMIRLFTADFYGHQVVHCHILPHEDRGQMTYYEILQPNQYCEAESGEIVTEPTTSTTREPTILFEPIIPTPIPALANVEDINGLEIEPSTYTTNEPSQPTILFEIIPTPHPTVMVFQLDNDIGQVTIEMCLIKEAIPNACSCGGTCSSVEYEYRATVSEKCGDQVLISGEYGAQTCNPANTIYEVGEAYKCKVLSCKNGEFDIIDSARSMFDYFWCFYIGLVFLY